MPMRRRYNTRTFIKEHGHCIFLSDCQLDHAPDDPVCRETFDDIRYFFLDDCLEPSEINEERIPLMMDALIEIRIQDAMKRHEALNILV